MAWERGWYLASIQGQGPLLMKMYFEDRNTTISQLHFMILLLWILQSDVI